LQIDIAIKLNTNTQTPNWTNKKNMHTYKHGPVNYSEGPLANISK